MLGINPKPGPQPSLFGSGDVRFHDLRFGVSGPSFPKGPRYCYGGILPQINTVIPNMETLHSTI